METCKRCGSTKFGFQFHSQDMGGIYTAVSPVCNKCADELKNEAVREFCKTNK